MSDSGFTVIDLIRAHGCEPEPRVSWPIGTAVREAYRARTGELPVKALRSKTSGPGSHCFAVYPETFRAEATDLVRALLESTAAARAAQGTLQW